MKRKLKKILALQIALITYLVGCVLWYFFWYKNGQLLHIALITLVTGSISVFIGVYKESNIFFIRGHVYKTISIISLIIGFVSFVGAVNYWCNKRVSNILALGPTKRACATVIAIDFKSTRSGKQAWSIVNYNAIGRTIEQTFADTSHNLKIGKKYLIKYSLNHPDMFKILDESK